MNPGNPNRHRIIGLTLLGLLFVGAIVFLLSKPGDDDSKESSTTVLTPTDSKQDSTAVTYNGFTDLSRRGLTSFQMNGIKYAFYQYAKDASTFTISPSSITQLEYNRDNPTPTVQLGFTIRIDDKTYTAKVDKYTDLVTVRVYLYTTDDKLIYDSQPLDSRKLKAPTDVVGG